MWYAPLYCFKTEDLAREYIETQNEFDKERLIMFYEPDLFKDEQYTVNID